MSLKFNTIVLIHGLWVTPLIWEPFRNFYGNLGYEVLAPPWPGITGSVADMRRDPSDLNDVKAEDVVAYYAKIIRGLPTPPIVMGHGYGGLITQLLLDRKLGAAGVAIEPIPPKGSLIRSLPAGVTLLPVLANSLSHYGTVRLSFTQFRRLFCNTLPESEARRAYAAQVIPAPCRPIIQAALASFTPGAATRINFKNPGRAPLLMISGADDVVAPASLVRSVFCRYHASPCLAEYKEFPGRGHYIIAEQGWQEVADYALTWALANGRARP